MSPSPPSADQPELEDLVLAQAPEFLGDMAAATEDLAAGRTRQAADVFAELDDEPPAAA